MTSQIENFLTNWGLNEKDIAVYLDIQRHGQSFASSVSLRTGIDRTTTYSSINRLLKMGIIVKTNIDNVAAYIPVSPEVFLDKIDNKISEMNSQKKTAKSFVEEMAKIGKHSFLKPRLRMFEGVEAIINLYRMTLRNPGSQKSFLTIKHIPRPLEKFLKETFIEEKSAKKVKSMVLIQDNPRSRKYQALDSKSNRETRLIKNHPFDLESEIILFNTSEIAIIDFNKKIYGILIDSKTLFKTIESIFDCLWESNGTFR